MTNDVFTVERLRELWKIYLECGQSEELDAYVRLHPESSAVCSHSYPVQHRIKDVALGQQWYRVSRCAACDERLYFIPTDVFSDTVGVPFWFSGSDLRKWTEEQPPVEPSTNAEGFWHVLKLRYQGRSAEDELISIAESEPDREVRAAAMDALTQLFADGPVSSEFLSTLRRFLLGDDPVMQEYAADSVASLGILLDIPVESLTASLDNDQHGIRLWAVETLMKTPNAIEAVEALKACLDDDSMLLRHSAARALWNITQSGECVVDVLTSELSQIAEGGEMSWLADSMEDLFVEAILILSQIEELPSTTVDVLGKLTLHHNAVISEAARDALSAA